LISPIRNAWNVGKLGGPLSATTPLRLPHRRTTTQVDKPDLLCNAIYLGAFLMRFSPKAAKNGISSKFLNTHIEPGKGYNSVQSKLHTANYMYILAI
jgi:hypothetical protein